MHAMSFVGTVAHVESEFAALRRRRRLDEASPVRRRVRRAMDGVADLVELVVATFPLPSLSRPPDEADDDAVRSVVRAAYERDEPVGPGDVAESVLDAGRVAVAAGEVVVPLRSAGPAAANWYVVYPWLGDRLDALAASANRLAGRLERSGWPAFADALDGLREVATDLRWIVGTAMTVTEWVAPPDGGIDDETRQSHRTASRLVEKLSNEL